MAAVTSEDLKPLAACIVLDAKGEPYLQGYQCSHCREVLIDYRRGCPQCAAVASLQAVTLSDRGSLFSFTIVHRSFPHIKTPFISVVVALRGGGYLKGNLEGVEPQPEKLQFDMPLRVCFDRLPAAPGSSQRLLRYYFTPAETVP
jgi:uncharacterized OB-fold protein